MVAGITSMVMVMLSKAWVNINGQNLLFDNNGKQIKGHLVRVNGVVRYFDPNSGEMAVNRWVEVSPGWWVYFDGEAEVKFNRF